MNIGDVIRDRRQKRNLTQAELAAILNVTPQAVSRWEMGISYPDIAMIPEISKTLWVTSDELLGMKLSGPDQKTAPEKDESLTQSQADSIFDYVPVPVSGEKKKVLVTDDADFMRMMLENILTREGHTVLQACNGEECLNILENETVDVCVLDIVMPFMDGIEVLRKIKERRPGQRVIMLSAMAREGVVRQALELGAEAFVVKPFHESSLIERIG